jgi:hypothetical protein
MKLAKHVALKHVALTIAALAAGMTVVAAQPTQDHDAHHPAPSATRSMQQRPAMRGPSQSDGRGMMGAGMAQVTGMMPMMAMMSEGMMPMAMIPAGMQPFAHIEGRIAFYKAELRITDAQLPLWDAFAAALRGAASRIQQALPSAPAGGSNSAPEQMERRITILSARLEAMQAVLAAGKPLYATLTDEQKHTADQLAAEHMMGMPGRGL